MHEYLSDEVYSALCNPWKLDIGVALRLRRSTEYEYPKCTLTDVLNNAEGFAKMIGDFRYSTWDDWISIGQSTTNNPYGLYLEMSAEQDRRIADAKARAETEAKMNVGFLGFKVCEECVCWKAWGEGEGTKPCPCDTPDSTCLRETTKTPGKYVEDVLSSATDLDMSKLGLADEIEEILGELASYLLRRVMGSGGLLDIDEPPPPSDPETDTLIKNINTLIETETIYLQTKEQTRNTYQTATSTYDSAKTCYETYLGLINKCEEHGGTMEKDEAYINERVSYIEGEIASINNTVVPRLNGGILNSEQIIADLETLETNVEKSTTYEEYYVYFEQYNIILTTRAHNYGDQITANNELSTADSIKEDADDELSACQRLSKECSSGY